MMFPVRCVVAVMSNGKVVRDEVLSLDEVRYCNLIIAYDDDEKVTYVYKDRWGADGFPVVNESEVEERVARHVNRVAENLA